MAAVVGVQHDWRLWYQLVLMTPGLGAWAQRRTGFLRFMLNRGVADPSKAWAPGEREHYAALFREPDRAGAQARMYPALWSLEGAKSLLRREPLNLPILLIHGTRDFAIGPRIQRSGWQPHAPKMSVELVEGGSYWLLNERPDLITARARDFFVGRGVT